MDARHRHILVLRGSVDETGARARELLTGPDSGTGPDEVLWVSERDEAHIGLRIRPRRVGELLGRSFDAVVLDVHGGLDADALGRCHGMVWGGGALVLRMPPTGEVPGGGRARMAAFPYDAEDVTHRFYRRFERALGRADTGTASPGELPGSARRDVHGTRDQARIVEQIASALAGEPPARIALLADRGRGKSSALGLALEARLERAADAGRPAPRVAVTAARTDATLEIFRFAVGAAADAGEPPRRGSVRFVALEELLYGGEDFEVVVVDEAAQISVAALRRLVRRHAGAHLVFATTVHGYEGTGRGFTLRFLSWLERHFAPVERLRLVEPIRWAPGDPLERFVFDALLLEAEPAALDGASPEEIDVDELVYERFDRDALAADEERLSEFFGLLVGAHYRTTPGDLHRMLDAPNLELHGLLWRDRVVAASLVAREGELTDELCEEIYMGGRRLRGHALPETFATHLGYPRAARMQMLRSVRIAVHPGLRRLGLGTELVERIHAARRPDLFGTLFGATPGVLAFRRGLGYRLVHVSASRNRRTGEPSVAMVHPISKRARALTGELAGELARELPARIELLEADARAPLDPQLVRALESGLPAPAELTEEKMRHVVLHYAYGPRTFETAATVLRRFVERYAERLDELEPSMRRLVEARVLEHLGWGRVTEVAGMPSVPASMRALRRAIRALVEAVGLDHSQKK